MTHAIEDLRNPVAQTVPIAAETDNENGLSNVDQWENDHSSPLPSDKNEEKIVTVVKKVTISNKENISYHSEFFFVKFKVPVPIPITKHGLYIFLFEFEVK